MLDIPLGFSGGLDVQAELLVLLLEELEDLAVRGHLLAHGPRLPGVDLPLLGVLVRHVLPSRLVLQKILKSRLCIKFGIPLCKVLEYFFFFFFFLFFLQIFLYIDLKVLRLRLVL